MSNLLQKFSNIESFTTKNLSHNIMRFSRYFLSIKSAHSHIKTQEDKKEKSWKIYDLSRPCIRCFSYCWWCDMNTFSFDHLSDHRVVCLLMIYWRKSHHKTRAKPLLMLVSSFFIFFGGDHLSERNNTFSLASAKMLRGMRRRDRKFFVLCCHITFFFVKNRLIFNFIFTFPIRLRFRNSAGAHVRLG